MITQEQLTSSKKSPNGFLKFAGGFVIDMPCILCENKTVYIEDFYDLLDFDGKGGINFKKIKFLDAYKKGFAITLVLLDLNSGELIKRSHRLGDNTLPCKFILIECFKFSNKSNHNDQLLKDAHD